MITLPKPRKRTTPPPNSYNTSRAASTRTVRRVKHMQPLTTSYIYCVVRCNVAQYVLYDLT